jgi:hypothetical protein
MGSVSSRAQRRARTRSIRFAEGLRALEAAGMGDHCGNLPDRVRTTADLRRDRPSHAQRSLRGLRVPPADRARASLQARSRRANGIAVPHRPGRPRDARLRLVESIVWPRSRRKGALGRSGPPSGLCVGLVTGTSARAKRGRRCEHVCRPPARR